MPKKDSKKRPKDVNLAEKKIADIKTLEVVTEPKKELSEVQIPKNAASEEQIPKEVEESPKDSGEKEVGEDGPSHQGLKKKALLVNSKISEYAKTRNLSKAKHEFRRFQKQSPDYVSVHTYTCLINACDRTDEAFALFEEMKQAGIVANAVTHTTLLKGLCNSGKLIQAHRHLVSMQAEGIEANSRTYDTLLRACARHGHAKLARALFAGILKHQLSPSQTSYECYIRALCINLEVEEAWRVAGAMQAANLAQNTAVFLELARASALVGDVPNCQKALWINDEVGPKGGGLDDLYKIGTKILERESKDQMERNEASSLCGTTLSERSKAHKKKELANKRSQALFAGHRAKIVESESAQVRAYLASVGTVGPRLPKLTFAPNRNDIPYMLFVTSSSPGGTIATSMTTSTHVPGLRAFQTSIWPAKYRTLLKSEPIHSASSSAANLEAAGADEQKQVATLLGLGSMAGGKTTLAINNTCIAPPARVCLELCSGVGDWVVAQAKQDSSVFSAAESAERHWIAVELLMDRAFTVWSKRAFEGLQNLTVVQGDARAVLRGSEDSEAETSVVNEQQSKKKLKLAISQQTAGCTASPTERDLAAVIASEWLEEVWINFPTPPRNDSDSSFHRKGTQKKRHGGGEAPESDDGGSSETLIDVSLLRSIYRVLRPGGTVNVVTDDSNYAISISAALKSLSLTHNNASQASAEAPAMPLFRNVHETDFSTALPAGYGTSYFDRLWTAGKRTKRYFLSYSRLTKDGSSGPAPGRPQKAPSPVLDALSTLTENDAGGEGEESSIPLPTMHKGKLLAAQAKEAVLQAAKIPSHKKRNLKGAASDPAVKKPKVVMF